MKTLFEWAVGLFVLFCFFAGFFDLDETPKQKRVREQAEWYAAEEDRRNIEADATYYAEQNRHDHHHV
ncbi:hypothetical protein [Paraburkholderia aromaticivorans]|uniref:Uncharacterized protein n=1 Tax=Paraburkholderia aromaticivorans TaxID=2026199 RepID=A0A248VXM6_9BURK|nr:hypothetical protein [Paraburkholderia aromaticivorans]ASW03774.1 hypothetical protein CJU94_36925 [Paraburkholderia aromaticivorans]